MKSVQSIESEEEEDEEEEEEAPPPQIIRRRKKKKERKVCLSPGWGMWSCALRRSNLQHLINLQINEPTFFFT